MSREKMYSAVEKVEGGAALVALIKSEFTTVDEEAKNNRISSKDFENQLSDATTKIAGLEKTITESSESTVPKTEMEKQINAITETLAGITKERDDEKKLNETLSGEKNQTALEKFYADSVSESFGSQGSNDAVSVSLKSLSYTEDGKMQYKDKVGDEGVELFKTDNARFLLNKGSGTPPASTHTNSDGIDHSKSSLKGFQAAASQIV